MFFSYFSPAARDHRRACAKKQSDRHAQIDALPHAYSAPLTELDRKILALTIAELAYACNAGQLTPANILLAYGKKALAAHDATNCLTDIFFDEALAAATPITPAAATASPQSSPSYPRPLAGVPISIKDCVDLAGHDTTLSYSRNVSKPAQRSAAIVRLLIDAGAILHCKTASPPGLLGLETSSDLWGRTTNPYNPLYSSGASTGGGGSLLAYGGSTVEIANDIGGSVRIPAHWCGIYGLKGSSGRWPDEGSQTCCPGLEAVRTVGSPMAAKFEDLDEIWRVVVDMKPWEYDHTCVPLPWREFDARGKKLRFGVIWDDGIISPTPACKRALASTVKALRKQGHEVIDFNAHPSVLEGLVTAFPLLFGDCADQLINPLRPTEAIEPSILATHNLLHLPAFVRSFLTWLARRGGDTVGASIFSSMHSLSIMEERALLVERNEYRRKWHSAWSDAGLDYVLSVPHSMPGLPRGGTPKVTNTSASYTFLWNYLDYSAGVLPITNVDKDVDALPASFSLSALHGAARGAYELYDADAMHGLPVGVQVVGRRFEEEKVLAGMRLVKDAMEAEGLEFVPREFS